MGYCLMGKVYGGGEPDVSKKERKGHSSNIWRRIITIASEIIKCGHKMEV